MQQKTFIALLNAYNPYDALPTESLSVVRMFEKWNSMSGIMQDDHWNIEKLLS